MKSRLALKAFRALAVSGAALLFLVSCATPGYRNAWKSAQGAPVSKAGIEGAWEGVWISDKNGHTGDLRCVVTKTGDDEYLFHYWATWAGGMKGAFKITCEAEERQGVVHVEGSKRLPPFGTYHHRGKLTATTFTATFRSDKSNVGSFELERVAE